MVVNRHKYFRWTARTGWLTVAYMIAFPAFIGYLGVVTDVRSLILRVVEERGRKGKVYDGRIIENCANCCVTL